jgi:hypothetical protein
MMHRCARASFFPLFALALAIASLLYPHEAPAQDSIPPVREIASDSLRKPTFFNLRRTPPNPKTSLRLSLLLPGSGQIYNGRWWKAPVAYGAIGTMAYITYYNQDRYQRLKTALELQLQNKPHEFSKQINSTNALRNLRNQYDKQTQLSYIGTAAVYVVVAVEAFVDAHLQNFDISEDLSGKLKPSLQHSNGRAPYPALALAFSF